MADTFRILFDRFGGKHGGFSGAEQIQLKAAVEDCYAFSALAAASAGNGFMGKRDLVRDWFGSSGPSAIKAVAAGVQKMHKVICDTSRTVWFVDARNQSERLYSSAQVPAPGAAGSGTHGATLTVQTPAQVVPMGAGDYAYVKCLGDHNPQSGTVAHVGSGMRVYMGERGFHHSKTLRDRSLTVYHELTHKALGTVDTNAAGQLVYGVGACKAFAAGDPAQALKHADCWCYFAASFKYTL